MKRIVSALFLFLFMLALTGHSHAAATVETATFAGGCFWCMEKPFDAIPGVISTTAGYTGGFVENPTYEQVSAGKTGHMEAVQVSYDPNRVSYQQLLDAFWRNIDPLDDRGQFCDKGPQYRSAIFYHTEDQRRRAVVAKEWLAKERTWQIVTEIRPAVTFYPAEEYHQDYYLKNPVRYRFYRANCGRDERLKELWGRKTP
jgi:peptide-methionine (S)-S-oxide reductase